MTAPKCTSWRGHKFEGRYSMDAADLSFFENASEFSLSPRAIEAMQKRTYECDVCVRCGHVVQPPIENHRA